MSGLGRDFAAAQARWDNMAPPEVDEDALTVMEARDIAETEALTTPHLFADWLASECAGHESPVDLWALRETFTHGDASMADLSAPALLALAVGCYDSKLTDRALSYLRDRYLSAQADSIGERADELLEQQDAQRRREAFERGA